MQSRSHIQGSVAERDPTPAWWRRLDRRQRTIALCGAAFMAGVVIGGSRSRRTAVVVRVHNQIRVRNDGTIGFLVRAARGR